ncbi:hypothetical protein KIN20_011505 [Parelaphostrongylus tenuis]|uniref:Uncharacterized protein n=1 Tax=Parelaphostrongylus tenuis TaxID=148309 RepID=A0AAD5MVG0_PARTN|nr:hypothetical protein KIN20_011505 [Parelaphostrongylus tenuis]
MALGFESQESSQSDTNLKRSSTFPFSQKERSLPGQLKNMSPRNRYVPCID